MRKALKKAFEDIRDSVVDAKRDNENENEGMFLCTRQKESSLISRQTDWLAEWLSLISLHFTSTCALFLSSTQPSCQPLHLHMTSVPIDTIHPIKS